MDVDATTYTSFRPLAPEETVSAFSLSRLFDFGRRATASPRFDSSAASSADEGATKPERKMDDTQHQVPHVMVSKSETNLPVLPRKEKGKYRNVKTILRRLSAIAIDRRWHQSTGDFKHNFKQYWMPDEHCKECYECGDKFNTFRRRHHCRVCGQIFCRKCCNQVVPGKVMGFTGDIRVCNYCYKIVQAYLNDSLEKSIEALREDMKVYGSVDELSGNEQAFCASGSLNSSRSSLTSYYFDGRDLTSRIPRASSSNSLPSALERDIHTRSPTPVRSVFDAFGVTPKEANTIKQDYLRDLWRQITNPNSRLELQSHRYRLKTYHNCFVGHELVDWMINYGKANNRAQAVALGQDLLDNGWIEAVYATDEAVFRDEYMLYQPGKVALHEMEFNLSFASQVSDSETSSKSACEDSDYLEESMTTVMEDDDVPIWFRQLSSDTVHTLVESENHTAPVTPVTSRRFSSGRHLDLDHVDPMESEYTKSGELSLQMKLDHFSEAEKLQVRKELYDQKSKLSLITHVPPPPLDTYVCVEGQAFTSKRKVAKVNSSAHLPDDVLHGVVFPKPGEEQSDLDETVKDDHCEKLAKDRLSVATQLHLLTLLDQLLEKEGLDASWKDVILPVVRKIREQVIPDVRRDDDMDIRQYVWFKKIPGGEKTDCQYISGVTFTKNVAHKKMSCSFQQPKILMLGCGIEYGQRVENKLTSLDPLVLQEYEFLKNFVARLVALKPNLVLVEKSVARIAQDMLLNAGITLIYNIKPSVMERVGRCTGADILQSMEQVTRPRLGTCQLFYLQKYPYLNGESKNLMFFEGCAPDLGCSLVLRGGNLDTLRRVKRIIKFLTYVAYHLKLETRFLLDEFALPPSFDDLKSSCSSSSLSSAGTGKKPRDTHASDQASKSDAISSGTSDDVLPQVDPVPSSEAAISFRKFLDSTILSSSPFCQYNLPFLLSEEAKDLSCRMFIPEKIYYSSFLGDDLEVVPPPEEPVEKDAHPNVIMRHPHIFTDPSVVAWLGNPRLQATVADYRARGGTIDLKMFSDYEEQEREKRRVKVTSVNSWTQDEKNTTNKPEHLESPDEEMFIDRDAGRLDPTEKLDCFDVYNHQRLAVLFSSYSSESHNAPKPCISPWAVFMEFYGRNDITLGGFLERYCFRPSYICPSHNCDIAMINHVRYFAHGTGSLYIHMRNLESPIPGYDRTILTWSWCKQCKQVTPVVPMSFESWSLSFAKYLELRFYGHQYKRRASAEPCQHSLHHDHFQYFSFANMVASFKYRQIELFEIIIPELTVEVGKDREPIEWCEDVRAFCTKAEININMLMDRIAALRSDKSTDPSINASRDLKIKEFMADIKKEYFHFNECIDCLKMKADSLRQAHANTQDTDDPYCTERSNTESLHLEPSEISMLKSDIANMIVKLKRDLCGIVEHWNSKLQEYVQQEKKREKNTRPPSPPKGESRASFSSSADQTEMPLVYSSSRHAKGTASPDPSNSNGSIHFQSNYYGTDDSGASIVHEPVSEIFYSNDRSVNESLASKRRSSPILADSESQPVDSGDVAGSWKTLEDVDKNDNSPMDGSFNDSYNRRSFRGLKDDNELLDFCAERVERKDSESFTVINAKEPTTMTFPDRIDEVTEKSSSSPSGTLESQQMRSTDPEITRAANRKVKSSTRNSSLIAYQGSFGEDEVNGYELSQDHAPLTRSFSDSKIFEGGNGPKEGMRKKTSDAFIVEHGQLDSKQRPEGLPSYLRVSFGSLGCSSETDSEHWMAATKPRTKTVINTLEGCVDTEPSFWKGHVDKSKEQSLENADALSCCSSMVVEIASEDDISELSSIRAYEDFDDADSCSLSSDDEGEEDEEEEESYGNEVVRGIRVGESAMDYGLPRLKEKVLKPRSQRHRADQIVESACTPRGVTSESTDSIHDTKTGNNVDGDGNTCTDGFREVDEHQMKTNFFVPIHDDSNHDDNAGSKLRNENSFPVKRPSALLAKQGSAYSEPAPIRDPHVSTIVALRPIPSDTGSTERSLSDSTSFTTKSSDAELSGPSKPVKTVRSPNPVAQQPGRTGIDGNWMPVHSRSEPALSQVLSSTQTVCTTSTAGIPFGHRRMASDPVLHDVVRAKNDTDHANHVDSPIIPGSPFVCLENDALDFRKRSQSQGNPVSKVSIASLHSVKEGQEELIKMAQLVCQEDRRDVELDDPEEIQYEEGIEACEQGKSVDGSKDVSTQSSVSIPASEVGDAEDTDVKKLGKRGKDMHGEDYESGKESVESSTVVGKKAGHERNKSLTQKYLASIVGDDTESMKLSSVEVSNSSATQNKKGTEKMKKIISQLLPAASFQPVPPPFPAHEHYMLPDGESIAIVINEKEPTSIIAYTLSSHDYQNELLAVQNMLEGKSEVTQATKATQHAPGTPKENNSEGKETPPRSPAPLLPKTDGNGVTLRSQMKGNSSRPKSWAGSTNLRSAMNLKNVLDQGGEEAGFLRGKPSPFGSSENIAEDSREMNSEFLNSGSVAFDGDSFPASPLRSRRAQTSDRVKKLKTPDDDVLDTDSGDDLLYDKEDARSEQLADGKKKEERQPTIDHHIKLQFQDTSAKFYCSVYFAEQFRRLRSIIFPEGEERYIRSVARCVLWRARGGKSGSSFSKSLDDRFVMKQMSRLELQSFVELGPHYFEYINKAIQEKRPTAMAKLLGVYRIGFKNSQTNTTMRQDLLVMENLFYKKKVNKVFDLKGSVRSRYVHTSGKEDVLMDENLLEMICDSPLFIRPHSKAILSKAIHNDTEFLAKHMVMDYSLLVGIDEVNYELVVGIIDYIRTFTWDKKLESYVKSTGILGGQGKMPTVVSPEVYQNRFMEAMHRYFLMVPDKWTGFGTELD